MAIIDVRGTHGSGKSFVMKSLIEEYAAEPVVNLAGEHMGYRLKGPEAFVLGKYVTACGGCDGIKTADEVVRRVRVFSKLYRHVLLEGILVAHTFSRYSALATELQDYRFFFLNTPLENCIARVRGRRARDGNTKELNPTNIIKDWHRIWGKLRLQCVEAGHHVGILDYRNPLTPIKEILNGESAGVAG